MPELTLPVLAALTPPDIEVIVTEEDVEDVTFKSHVDLVGISCLTPFASRAYEIADEYRRQGVRVVLGGIHASALPEEAIRHADAVVIGEAENVWPQLIQDFRTQRLKPLYKSDGFADLTNLPLPRRDLLKKGMTFSPCSLQTSRGCPFRCDFCSVTRFFGGTYRTRPVEEVIREIELSGKKRWIFIDDNIIGNTRYARELFRRLIPLKIRWVGQSTLLISADGELLNLAVRSGCRGLFIGFESLNEASLKGVNKGFNRVRDYETSIKKLHDHGILLCASFVFGFDHDDPSVFERTLDFLKRNKVGVAALTILVPFPGTRLYQKLHEEGRILTRDWSKYNYTTAVFRPRLMEPHTLEEGTRWVISEFYSRSSVLSRFVSNWRHPLLYPVLNANYRKRNKGLHPKKDTTPPSLAEKRPPTFP